MEKCLDLTTEMWVFQLRAPAKLFHKSQNVFWRPLSFCVPAAPLPLPTLSNLYTKRIASSTNTSFDWLCSKKTTLLRMITEQEQDIWMIQRFSSDLELDLQKSPAGFLNCWQLYSYSPIGLSEGHNQANRLIYPPPEFSLQSSNCCPDGFMK